MGAILTADLSVIMEILRLRYESRRFRMLSVSVRKNGLLAECLPTPMPLGTPSLGALVFLLLIVSLLHVLLLQSVYMIPLS